MNLTADNKARKETPVVTGVLDYFPLAIAAVARVSYKGNQKHNPGQPLHWARDKSTDHVDCVGRHLLDRHEIDPESGETELAHAAWRVLAMLQIQQENLPKGNDNCRDGRSLGEQQRAIEACNRKPICYLSGPMRGYPDFNFPAFDKAKKIMLQHGYEVISPADMDREDKNQKPGVLQDSVVYMDRDVAAIRSIAVAKIPWSCLVTLEGHEASVGARAEVALAKWLGIPVRHIAEFKSND